MGIYEDFVELVCSTCSIHCKICIFRKFSQPPAKRHKTHWIRQKWAKTVRETRQHGITMVVRFCIPVCFNGWIKRDVVEMKITRIYGNLCEFVWIFAPKSARSAIPKIFQWFQTTFFHADPTRQAKLKSDIFEIFWIFSTHGDNLDLLRMVQMISVLLICLK